jgi:rhomboid protease GluP
MGNTIGSKVCPYCRKLVSANSRECMHCGRRLSKGGFILRDIADLFHNTVDTIIYVCIGLYILSLLIDPAAILNTRGFLDILAPSMDALSNLGATGWYFAIAQGRWWTLFTAIYLHGNLLHIIFNMLWLRQLGHMVDDLFGGSRTFLIFTISGLVGFVISNILGIMATIGASGSIFGLLGALIYYGRHRGGHFGTAIYKQVGSWALILFLIGFMMPAVNNFAHAGGFIGGYLSAKLLGYQELMREAQQHRYLAIGALVLTVLSFLAALGTAIF